MLKAPQYHYETVSEAMQKLRAMGFTTEFSLKGNQLVCTEGEFEIGEFEIIDVYRYEGDSDPGDEAVVYGIKSKDGLKGILVAGYGSSNNAAFDDLVNLHMQKK